MLANNRVGINLSRSDLSDTLTINGTLVAVANAKDIDGDLTLMVETSQQMCIDIQSTGMIMHLRSMHLVMLLHLTLLMMQQQIKLSILVHLLQDLVLSISIPV